MREEDLNLLVLLDGDAHADAVDRGLDKAFLLLGFCNEERSHQQLGVVLEFDFRVGLALH